MTGNASEPEPSDEATTNRPPRQPILLRSLATTGGRLLRARIGRIPIAGILGVIAIAALLIVASDLGNPSSGSAGSSDHGSLGVRAPSGGYPIPEPAASMAMAAPTAAPAFQGKDLTGTGSISENAGAPTDQTQIVKTGSMAIEVQDLNKAIEQARSTIIGMGGYVSDSTRSGDGQSAVSTITYRLPVARWDDALTAFHGLASKLISEQTNSTDVTAQVIDLDARINNLKATEAALQGIMAKAVAIPDVLAVEEQLSSVQGQIEQLSAQQNHLKDQAAMSTLAVTFMTPTTVTAQATQGWDLSNQVDQAVAALVHIGQGLVTIGVWILIVGVPIVVGVLIVLMVLWIVRRVFGRRRPSPAAGTQV
jgi:hypothetical protein